MPGKRKPVRVGVTGGIGAGKSTICGIFSVLGIPVYLADDRAKFLMENNPQIAAEIVKKFSEQAYQNGKLNRAFLAGTVFNDDERLHQLNEIVHPQVIADFEEWASAQADVSYLIKEAALLFESGSYLTLDKVILVCCPPETRIRRILLRDTGRSREEIEKIIEKQWSDQEKKKLADFVIENDDSIPVLPRVLTIHEQLLQFMEK